MLWQKLKLLLLLPLFCLSCIPQRFTNAARILERKMGHPGLLHNADDLKRMKDQVAAAKEPWISGWYVLTNNSHASATYRPSPVPVVERGAGSLQNYSKLMRDMAAAYALALRWHISGDKAFADTAIAILNAWSSTMTGIGGNSDKFLASGLYGYQMANAGELMRDYPGWAPADLKKLQDILVTLFYPMNHRFLVEHNGVPQIDHYWANWDLCNMASMLAIGVFADRPDYYTEATEYFKKGQGNGALSKAIWILYEDPTSEGLGQIQESGRDQGHTTLDIALLGAFCQMAWNQGDDLFGYDNNRVLKGSEYVARYNLLKPVPYTEYKYSGGTQPNISSKSIGYIRPMWELLYNHYVVLKGLKAPDVTEFAKKVRPEGGGGNYGQDSGGYDQFGYGTLTYTLK